MIGLWLRLMGALALLTFTIIGVTCAQPYDDHGLSETLLTTDCQLPCFMGIRPGVTTQDAALQLLKMNPWVAQVSPLVSVGGFTWTWNGQQPAFLQDGFASNTLLIVNGVVQRVDFLTRESMATFLIRFGLPEAWMTATWQISNLQFHSDLTHFRQSAAYPAYTMEVVTQGVCSLSVSDQWALPAQISLFARQNHIGYDTYDHMPLVAISFQECRP